MTCACVPWCPVCPVVACGGPGHPRVPQDFLGHKVIFVMLSSSLLVCPHPRCPLVSSRPSRVLCFPTRLSSSHPVYTPRAVAHGGGGGVLAALVPPRSSFQSPSSPPHPPTLPRLRRPHSTCDPPHEQSLVRLGAGGVVRRLASLRCYQQLRT